jgi:hypothetical protein
MCPWAYTGALGWASWDGGRNAVCFRGLGIEQDRAGPVRRGDLASSDVGQEKSGRNGSADRAERDYRDDGPSPRSPARRPNLRPFANIGVGGRGRRPERLLLAQDRLLQLAEPLARVDPQLFEQHPTRVLVSLKRLGLSAGAVEREHQLGAVTLSKRMVGHQPFELRHEIGVSTQHRHSAIFRSHF